VDSLGLDLAIQSFHAPRTCVDGTTLESCNCGEDGCSCSQSRCDPGSCRTFSPTLAACVVSQDPWPGCDPARGYETECEGEKFYGCIYGYRLTKIPGRCMGVCVPNDGQALCSTSP